MNERPTNQHGINVLLYAITHAIDNADEAFARYNLEVAK